VTNDWSGTTGDPTPGLGSTSQQQPATRSGRRHGRSTAPRRGSSRSAQPANGRKRRRWVKRSVLGVSAVVVLALLLGAGGWFYINYRIGQIPRVKVVGLHHEQKPGQPINILLVGSDSRSTCTTASCQSHLGDQGASGGQRSDVIIILRLVPANRTLEMLSIPRDTWVSIAGSGGQDNRINAAFNTGAAQLVKTIEQDFHIPINHYAYADFPGFTDAVQALGGVYLDFPDPLKDAMTGLNIKKTGCQLLNGVEALQLVRSRDTYYFRDGQWTYDGLGDLSRIRRQEAFFHAIIKKADSDYNPIQLNSFIANIVKNIQIDTTFTTSELIHLAVNYRGVASGNLSTEVLPTSGATTTDGQDVLLPVWSLDNAMIASFLKFGTTTPKPKSGTTSSTSSTSSTSTTTTMPQQITGTTTVPIVDNAKNYPEPWNPVPCGP
jgi:LCP family protein required for cell wall assembly